MRILTKRNALALAAALSVGACVGDCDTLIPRYNSHI